jgi:hypothetical protein
MMKCLLFFVCVFAIANKSDAKKFPAVPTYLEPGYHFVLPAHLSSEDIVKYARTALERTIKLYETPVILKTQNKTEFTLYTPQKMGFVVTFYENKAGNTVVEFQRSHADVLKFNQVFSEVKRLIAPQASLNLSRPNGSDSVDTLTLQSWTGHAADTHRDQKNTVDALLKMLASHYVDVKKEALLALIELEPTPWLAGYLLNADLKQFPFPKGQERFSAVLFDLYLNYSEELKKMSFFLGKNIVLGLGENKH